MWEDVAYLVGALADGGLYEFRYGSRTEYRCVWTQADETYLAESIVPRLRRVMENLGVSNKIRLLKGSTRFEVRVSSKKLYTFLRQLFSDLGWLANKPIEVKLAYVRGLFDAEGEKTGRRIRLWNKRIDVLAVAKDILGEVGIAVSGPYADDKRHGVYVIEVPAQYRKQFIKVVKPEHPRLNRSSRRGLRPR